MADNPGGGGRGNTMFILEAFHAAGVRDALVGIIHDPLLAREAHGLGEGATVHRAVQPGRRCRISRGFSRRRHASGGCIPVQIRGRRGIFADNSIDFGPSVALEIGGIVVVVVSQRVQCADPVFFEAFGLDIAAARVVVVKSRGHFRGGFDEFFGHEQVIEVDAPGLTSPVLRQFPWTHLPRPVLPLDARADWVPTPRPGDYA